MARLQYSVPFLAVLALITGPSLIQSLDIEYCASMNTADTPTSKSSVLWVVRVSVILTVSKIAVHGNPTDCATITALICLMPLPFFRRTIAGVVTTCLPSQPKSTAIIVVIRVPVGPPTLAAPTGYMAISPSIRLRQAQQMQALQHLHLPL